MGLRLCCFGSAVEFDSPTAKNEPPRQTSSGQQNPRQVTGHDHPEPGESLARQDSKGRRLSARHRETAKNGAFPFDATSIAQSSTSAWHSTKQLKSKYKVNFDELMFHETVGKGSFKTVYRGRWGNTNVAIVRMRKGGMITEARVMQRLSTHPNLVQFYRWSCDDAGNEYVVMELISMGSLDRILMQFGHLLRTRTKLTMCEQICSAMCELQKEGVIHRDLAVRNVLVASIDPVHVKVSDFGLARDLGSSNSKAGVLNSLPVRWIPPEVMTRQEWSEKSDVWAFGVTMWEIFSNGSEPYASQADVEVVRGVCEGMRLPRPQRCPKEVYELMQLCWSENPAQRPRFEDIAAKFKHWHAEYQKDRARNNSSSSLASGSEPGLGAMIARTASRTLQISSSTGSDTGFLSLQFNDLQNPWRLERPPAIAPPNPRTSRSNTSDASSVQQAATAESSASAVAAAAKMVPLPGLTPIVAIGPSLTSGSARSSPRAGPSISGAAGTSTPYATPPASQGWGDGSESYSGSSIELSFSTEGMIEPGSSMSSMHSTRSAHNYHLLYKSSSTPGTAAALAVQRRTTAPVMQALQPVEVAAPAAAAAATAVVLGTVMVAEEVPPRALVSATTPAAVMELVPATFAVPTPLHAPADGGTSPLPSPRGHVAILGRRSHPAMGGTSVASEAGHVGEGTSRLVTARSEPVMGPHTPRVVTPRSRVSPERGAAPPANAAPKPAASSHYADIQTLMNYQSSPGLMNGPRQPEPPPSPPAPHDEAASDPAPPPSRAASLRSRSSDHSLNRVGSHNATEGFGSDVSVVLGSHREASTSVSSDAAGQPLPRPSKGSAIPIALYSSTSVTQRGPSSAPVLVDASKPAASIIEELLRINNGHKPAAAMPGVLRPVALSPPPLLVGVPPANTAGTSTSSPSPVPSGTGSPGAVAAPPALAVTAGALNPEDRRRSGDLATQMPSPGAVPGGSAAGTPGQTPRRRPAYISISQMMR